MTGTRSQAADVATQLQLFTRTPVFCLAIEDERSSLDALRGFVRFAREGGIAVGTAGDFAREFPCPDALDRAAFTPRPGERVRIEDLFRRLVEAGYHPTELSAPDPGTFLRRTGGTLDLWPVNATETHRITWDGDEIEAVQPFDAGKNELGARVPELAVFPQTAEKKVRVRDLMTRDTLLVRDELDEKDGGPELADFGKLVAKIGVKILAFSAFGESADGQAEYRFASVLRYPSLDEARAEIAAKIKTGWRVVIATHRAEEVAAMLGEAGIPAETKHTDEPETFADEAMNVLKTS